MDHTTELEQVNTAFFLERALAQLEDDLSQLERSKPHKPGKPAKPLKVIPRIETLNYPPVLKTDVPFPSFMKAALLICAIAPFFLFSIAITTYATGLIYLGIALWFLGIPACLIGGFVLKSSLSEQKMDAERNSAEYRARCEKIDEENEARALRVKRDALANYEQALAKYESEDLPAYERRLADFENDALPRWTEKKNALQVAIEETRAALQEVYAQNTIPGKYRNLPALAFISAYMGTSQYDLKFSIEQYNDELHMINEKLGLDLAAAQRDLMEKTAGIAEYNSYLTEQSIVIAEQANQTLKSLKHWSTASAAIQGYSAFTQQRLLKAVRKE